MSNRSSPVGTVLADAYRLTRVIAEGGMSIVYEAIQIRLDRRFAVKLMSREAAANPEALARFRREAQITSQLAHPHVIYVADVGTTDQGEPYLVMEYLEGEDLEQRLRRVGRFTLAGTVHVVKQVASALSASHAKGIVHRDLKPANIFLLEIEGETDFVKVVDFGISKLRRPGAQITRPSVLMGTPSYMPPEQALGNADGVDHRADQWALAAVAWEMLTGQPPFVRKDLSELLNAIAHEETPSLATRIAGLPPDVDKTLRRALAKSPGDRFPTVAAFARALDAAATSAPAASTSSVMPATPASPPADIRAASAAGARPRRRRRALLAAAIAIPVAATAVFLLHPGGRPAADSKAATPVPSVGATTPPARAAEMVVPTLKPADPRARAAGVAAATADTDPSRSDRGSRRPHAEPNGQTSRPYVARAKKKKKKQ